MPPARGDTSASAFPYLPPQPLKDKKQEPGPPQQSNPPFCSRCRGPITFQGTSADTNSERSLSEPSLCAPSLLSFSPSLSSTQSIAVFPQQTQGTEIAAGMSHLTLSDLPLPPPAYETSGSGIHMIANATESFDRLQHISAPTFKFRKCKDHVRIPKATLLGPSRTPNSNSKGAIRSRFFSECYQPDSPSPASSSFSNLYGILVILTATDTVANWYNDVGFNSLPPSSPSETYRSIRTDLSGKPIVVKQRTHIIQDLLKNPIRGPRRPPLTLKLKVGVPIILLEDIDRVHAGTLVIVENLEKDVIFAKTAMPRIPYNVAGKGKGRAGEVGVEREGRKIQIRRQVYSENTNIISYKRNQFPVKRAFALAVGDVTEGMMFDELGLDLTPPLDATGQLYSTLMRCRDPNRVKVLVPTAKG